MSKVTRRGFFGRLLAVVGLGVLAPSVLGEPVSALDVAFSIYGPWYFQNGSVVICSTPYEKSEFGRMLRDREAFTGITYRGLTATWDQVQFSDLYGKES